MKKNNMFWTIGLGDAVKKISYLDLQRLFCPAKQTILYNFGRGHYLEHFCEIYFEFGPVVHEILLKKITYLEL